MFIEVDQSAKSLPFACSSFLEPLIAFVPALQELLRGLWKKAAVGSYSRQHSIIFFWQFHESYEAFLTLHQLILGDISEVPLQQFASLFD